MICNQWYEVLDSNEIKSGKLTGVSNLFSGGMPLEKLSACAIYVRTAVWHSVQVSYWMIISKALFRV